ncbi:MAG: DUF58 domain-containing protein [Ignisphaera sp.]
MELLNLWVNENYYSYTTLHSLRPSKGIYTLFLLGVFAIICIYYSEYVGYFPTKVMLSTILYVVSITIAADLAVTELMKYINIEIKSNSIYEVIEDLSVTLELQLKPLGIAKLINIKKVNLNTDTGLRTLMWKFNKLNHCLEVEVSGYPGKHSVYGLTVDLEPPLSILRISFKITFVNPIEIRVIPIKSRHIFNVEAVVPHLPLIEGRSSRRKGVGSEVFSVREFMPFDDFKRIHWKASAKVGKLMVKEYEHRMYRNAVVVTSIHNGFFTGEPPPIIFLFKMVIDVFESLSSMGLKVALGVVTEEDIKIVNLIDRYKLHEVYRILSEVKWPKDISFAALRYTSSNRILRWFTQTVVEEVCRDPCLVVLVVDPLDEVDISAISYVTNILENRNHSVKILLTTPLTLRFVYSSIVNSDDVAGVLSETMRVKKVLAKLKSGTVYLPTAYIKS